MISASRGNQWIIGGAALLGAMAALMLLPRARSTAAAQVMLALGRQPEWMKAAEGGHWKPIEQVVAAHPNGSAIQLAAATLPPHGRLALDETRDLGLRGSDQEAAETVRRLQALAKQFPDDPKIWAHLLRHLTRKAVRLDRPEEREVTGSPIVTRRRLTATPPSPDALRTFAMAAEEGRRLDPDNGYFDAMRAVEEFVERNDEAALHDLRSASEKPRWNDYTVEETRAQWELLANAYGDRGAAQKVRAYEGLLFPHYVLLRQAAHLAIWHASDAERRGDEARSREIRHALMQLGIRLAETDPISIGKYVGLAMFEDGGAPVPPDRPLSALSAEAYQRMRRERRERYERLLRGQGQVSEADWVRTQRERADALAARLQQSQSLWQEIATIRFSPAGWAGWWTLGIILWRQIGALLALWGVAVLLSWRSTSGSAREGRSSSFGWAAVSMPLLVTGYFLMATAPLFGINWSKPDVEIALRLVAAALVVWGAVELAGRGGHNKGYSRRQQDHLWLGIVVALSLIPVLLSSMTGSEPLLKAALAVGLGSMTVLLGLTRLAGGKGDQRSGVPRWRPDLVALLAVLPSAGLLFLLRNRLSSSDDFTTILMGRSANLYFWQPETDPAHLVPALVLLPVTLLLLVQLCRVVALRMPVRTGMARGLRRTAPIAAGLLLAVYVAALVPTIRSDRAAERFYDRLLTDELSLKPGTW